MGIGAYRPVRSVGNDEICRVMDSSDEWIFERTGIGMVILASSSWQTTVGHGAPQVAHALGVNGVPAFDIECGCGGFGSALGIAADMVRADSSSATARARWSSAPARRTASRRRCGPVTARCRPAGVPPVFIPQQANARINELMAKNLGLAEDVPVANDIENTGNTSAASIPLAMEEMLVSGKAKGGQIALMLGFGACLSYAGRVVTLPPAPLHPSFSTTPERVSTMRGCLDCARCCGTWTARFWIRKSCGKWRWASSPSASGGS